MTTKHNKRPLFDSLVKYSNSKVTPFDVPGHKMGKGIHKDFIDVVGKKVFELDINSMKEMDNLSNPEGVILEAEKLAADLFDSDNAFFIVNGSTAGVQNMILSAVNPNEKIIIPRNIHKSAINALVLSGAKPVYMYPEISPDTGISFGTSTKNVLDTIELHSDAKAILLLNPTYYGFSNDLKRIIDFAHSKNMLVLVDESHGTHFYLDNYFPNSSMSLGADLSTISVHKTGGSLTQSSILLHNNERIPKAKVRSVINLSQTSSASYLLMASLDIARHNLATNVDVIKNVIELSTYANKQVKKIKNLTLVSDVIDTVSDFQHDPSKLLIDVSRLGKTGYEIYDILKKDYNIQIEFGETLCILAIISVGDTKEDIDTLLEALRDLSIRFDGQEKINCIDNNHVYPTIQQTPREAFFSNTIEIPLEEANGKISADQLMVYPPGIPLVVPGEIINENIITEYRKLIEYGNQVIGSTHNGNVKIRIVKE